MNILLTSAGRRTYLVYYFKNALGNSGELHASNSVLTNTLLMADKYVITPNIYDDNYIDFVINYCKENSIKAVIPLFDIDLQVLSNNRDKFTSNGIFLIVSNPEIIKICNDKWVTFNFLSNLGIKTPKTYIDTNSLTNDLNAKLVKYPIIIKPRWGMGSIGIFRAENHDELTVLTNKLKREIFNTYLKYESTEDIDRCVIYQELIKGDEYGLDVLNDLDGNLVTIIAKKKLAMRSGETDIAEIVDAEIFRTIGTKISQGLRHIANLDIDCFVNEQNEIFVLELNCRFGGQYPFSHLAGVDFPKQIIKWLNGETTDKTLITPEIGAISCKEITPTRMK